MDCVCVLLVDVDDETAKSNSGERGLGMDPGLGVRERSEAARGQE